MQQVARAAQAATWVPVGHLLVLTVLGSLRPPEVAPRPVPRHRFVVVVPARDEERVVSRAVRSLREADYPPELLRVVVLADNCSDGTADVARSAGAEAWERHDATRANKGAALAWAFGRLLAEDDPWDAVLVLDADGTVAPDLFRVLDVRLDDAPVLQAERRVGNPSPTVLSRLSEVSTGMQTVLRPRARQCYGGAAKLVGTGMVLRRQVLVDVPWRAEGLVEDLEHWLQLLERGVRPQFEPRAQVADLMPETMADVRRQRERWQAGRDALVGGRARSALRDAVRRRDLTTAEAVVSELLLPTLSVTGALVVGTAAASRVLRGRGTAVGAAQAAVVTAHVLAGLRASDAPPTTYGALALAPFAVVWKTALVLRTRLRPPAAGWQGARSGAAG